MRTLWVDASDGAAGDMLLGALLDAGASLDAVRAAVAAVAPEAVSVTVEATRRHGLRCSRAVVDVADSATHRGLGDVLALVRAGALAPSVEVFVVAVFTRLATAEARVHGSTVDEVHFHEVGALDAIADVVGCAAALHDLGLLPGSGSEDGGSPVDVVVGTLALGSGRTRSAHGSIPVPVPAVLALLEGSGAPVVAGPGQDVPGAGRELCTPTGAALLLSLADRFGPTPALSVAAVGVGAGTADPPGAANVLRVVVGDGPGPGTSGAPSTAPDSGSGTADGSPAWRVDDLLVLEATVDDLDPRLWPDALDALHAAGALDAWAAPVLMRHGRPGHVVTALAPPDALAAARTALVLHTTTLGVRCHAAVRWALPRTARTVDVGGHEVSVKLGHLDGAVVTAQPEHADAAAAATALGLPVRTVLERAQALARGLTPPPASARQTGTASTARTSGS